MKILLPFYFVIIFYSIGALTIENDVNYETWKLISAGDFQNYHKYLESLLKGYMFAPLTAALLLNAVLIFTKLFKRYRIYFIISLIVLAFILAYSLLVQVPLHVELENNYNEKTLEMLIQNHKRIRLPATMLLVITNTMLLFHIIKGNKS